MISVDYKGVGLTSEEESSINELLKALPGTTLELEEVWALMDTAWDECDCDNRNPFPEPTSLNLAEPGKLAVNPLQDFRPIGRIGFSLCGHKLRK